MNSKYCDFSDSQLSWEVHRLRKKIFFLILTVDPKTKMDYESIDVTAAFNDLLNEMGGLNRILFEPPQMVSALSLLEAALVEYKKDEFNWEKYRKLVFDAGNEVKKFQEV